jgi:hypothetical protein
MRVRSTVISNEFLFCRETLSSYRWTYFQSYFWKSVIQTPTGVIVFVDTEIVKKMEEKEKEEEDDDDE